MGVRCSCSVCNAPQAILRGAGLKALHDEDETFRDETIAAAAAGASRSGPDGYSFTIAFKGVLLEGLEVVFIVLTFGANQHRVGLAALAATLAVSAVVAAGLAAGSSGEDARERDEVQRRRDAYFLRHLLGAEGAGARWPGSDAALLVLAPLVLTLSLVLVWPFTRRAGGNFGD